MAPAAALLGVLAIVEVLAFGPVSCWVSPRLWLVQLAGTGLVTCVAGLLAWLIATPARRFGRSGPEPADLILCFGASASCTAHCWQFLGSRVQALFPRLPDFAAILTSFVLMAVIIHLVLTLTRRSGVARRRVVPLLAGALAAPILIDAMTKTATTLAERRGLRAPALGLAILLLAGLLLASPARRRGWGVVSAVLVLAILGLRVSTLNPHDWHGRPATASAPAAAPPLLLIVLDTFRADALDLAEPSRSKTPNLARLARDSDVYTNAVANASWTLPGHASILTGRLVSQHRLDITFEPGYSLSLSPDIPTAHELFGRSGYPTTCIVANPGVGPGASNLLRGCRRSRNPGRGWILSLLPLRLVDLMSRSSRRFIVPQLLIEATGVNVYATGGEIVDAALAELPDAPSPLYMFLNFMDVHLPYPADAGTPLRRRVAVARDMAVYLAGGLDIDAIWERHARTLHAYYDDRVVELDRQIGRLLDELRARDWYDRMAIVLTADHGEAFRENPNLPFYYAHHGAYEPAVRIPLMVKRPSQRTGTVHPQAVQQVDILPTMLALAHLPSSPSSFGRPLGTESDAVIVTEWNPRLDAPDGMLPHKRVAIYSGPYKYVRDGKAERLYDLGQAPYETVDVLDRMPGMAARLSATLGGAIDGFGPLRLPEQTDPLVLEKLRALGYVR